MLSEEAVAIAVRSSCAVLAKERAERVSCDCVAPPPMSLPPRPSPLQPVLDGAQEQRAFWLWKWAGDEGQQASRARLGMRLTV